MTDDFQLFDQSSDDPVDADIALITAYLARELSPVQIVAVEDRLANDAAFLKKVQPILDAWVLPPALSAVHAGQGPLSRDEVEAGWARYVGERAELDAHEGPQLVVEGAQRKRRKISMTRIAAGVAAITLPVLALAQVVVYASKHPSVPGHTVAKNMVAPFVVEPPPVPEPRTPTPQKPPPEPVDVRVGRELEKARTTVQRGAQVQVPAAESVKIVPTEKPSPAVLGPRDKVIALVKQHMPEVVRGDTAASYAVIVLDATDNYVWSTHGLGAVQLVIGGDKRTPAERADFSFKNVGEYTGLVRDTTVGARGGGGGTVFLGRNAVVTSDSNAVVVGGRGVGGGARGGGGAARRGAGDTTVTTRLVAIDSILTTLRTRDSANRLSVRFDSLMARGGGGAGASGGLARGGGGGGRGGGAGGFMLAGLDSGSYVIGAGRARDVQSGLNSAAGLQEPGKGESGIQGLKASSLTMGESFNFAMGQLTPRPFRVFVVHLAPGTSWKGR